jgi:hypothetical protein
MSYIVFPSDLPNPSQVGLKPAERRRLSGISDGYQQVGSRQRDFLGEETLQWELTAAQAQTFDDFFKYDLTYGGAWFQADWPLSHAMDVATRRFITPPKWSLIGHEYWRVSATFELRGKSLQVEPGGTRLYDLAFTMGELSTPSSGSTRLAYPPFTELNVGWYLKVVLHNTSTPVPTGPSVVFSFVVEQADTTHFTAITSLPSYTSTTGRDMAITDGTSGSSGAPQRGLGSIPGFYYGTVQLVVSASVDGVDTGMSLQLVTVPDLLTPSGVGVISGYPGGIYNYATDTWTLYT